MTLPYPPALRPGDRIGVMAPSSWVAEKNLAPGVAALESRGFKVEIHPQTFMRDRQSAGTPEQKISALHDLWADPEVRAIMAAGGGNRCLHILSHLDPSLLRADPKAFVGFSDVTALVNAIPARAGLVAFHGPVLETLREGESLDSLCTALSGAPRAPDMTRARAARPGRTRGVLIGGNLSIVQYLAGTDDFLRPEGAILFLEDVAEELSKIDRMLLHLKRTGVLSGISGLVLGGFDRLYETGKPFEFTLGDLIREHTQDFDYPVIMNAPFGHAGVLETFPVGAVAEIEAQESGSASLKFL